MRRSIMLPDPLTYIAVLMNEAATLRKQLAESKVREAKLQATLNLQRALTRTAKENIQ